MNYQEIFFTAKQGARTEYQQKNLEELMQDKRDLVEYIREMGGDPEKPSLQYGAKLDVLDELIQAKTIQAED